MERIEINKIANLLKRIESSEGIRFKQQLKENKILEYIVFDDFYGVLVVYKDDLEYNIVCAFKNIVKDYNIILKVERIINKYLKLLKDDEVVSFAHEGKQLFMNHFICKLNFNKPHYGLKYKLKRKDFDFENANELNNLLVLVNEEDAYNKLFNLHVKAFEEQNIRTGVIDGYDDEDLESMKRRFSNFNEEKKLFTFYLNDKLIGYSLFDQNELDLLAVDPTYQGKNFGKTIIRYSINEIFKNKDINNVYLYTFLINLKAQSLYEQVGFKKINFFCINDSKNKKDIYLK